MHAGTRCKGSQVSMEAHNLNKQKLSPQHELELVDYIKGLSKRGLPPTREMTRRFASEIGNYHIGNGWVGRFLGRNKHHLTLRWTKGMDAVRHKADSEANYKLYFDLLHQKMKEYNIEPRHTYNMDEKGFVIGVIGKSKGTFSKMSWESKDARAPIQDGHGSHVTMDFIEYCDKNRILLAVFPPHSTHSLQPLDVVCFAPLAGSYTNKLITNTQHNQGLLPLEKGDFFLLFWHAWTSTFTEKLILKSFESTGIWPMEKDVILKRFCSRRPDEADQPKSSPVLADKDWRRMRTLVEHIVRKGEEESAKKITLSLYHLQVQNDFLLHENKDLHTALTTKRSARRRARPLTFNSVKSFMVGLFSGVLGRSMRLVSMRG
jgi:hypothetical protein